MGTRKITNTTAEVREAPMLGLLTGSPAGIEAQERAGQGQLVHSESLPAKGSENPTWAKLGVTFGATDPADPLFRPATLPAGWKKERTDHSMWSKLVDDKGRQRALIFYKAAFYDRDAFMNLKGRFSIRRVYDNERPDRLQVQVLDCDASVFSTEPEDREHPKNREDWQAFEDAEKAHSDLCRAWLTERYPNWDDVTAHWD